MSSPKSPNGLYEISPSGSNVFLSILHDAHDAAIVLVPRGTEHAAQLVRTNENGRTTLRNIKHGVYASFHGAFPGHPLLGTATPRDWIAELQPNCFGQHDEYTLKVLEGPDDPVHILPVIWLYAGFSPYEIYPLPAVLEKESETAQKAWTFRRVLLATEVKRA